MKIVVAGGGTAGLISALILKRKFNYEIDVICSKKIGIIGVGEGSTEHFKEFMDYLGIDEKTIIKECGATYKSGILFDGWSDEKYLHSVMSPFDYKNGQYQFVYAKQILEGKSHLHPKNLLKNELNLSLLSEYSGNVFNQFHFDTHKLNSFLINLCIKSNIKIIDDEILDVKINDSGEIENIVGEKQIYSYNFYIDATGFKKILISKLGYTWKSFSEYLTMNSAIVFPSQEEENYNVWTLAKSMEYGWRFKIPVQGRCGNGYIFNNSFISADEAKEELDKELGYDVEVAKEFKFDPGYVENPWIKNCVAIGLSSSFVEPLEATSIGTSIQQSFMLMHKIANYSPMDIKSYNKDFISIMNNIRDFIFLHYMKNTNKNDMWKHISEIKIPDSLKDKLDTWNTRLPIKEDFNMDSRYILFYEANFLIILNGLNMININNIQKEYDASSFWVKDSVNKIIQIQENFELSMQTVSHKKVIEAINKYF